MELNSLVNWILPVVLAVVILLLLYMYGTWTHTKWHKYNIPGPAPVPFFGNMIDIWKKGLINASLDWRSKYGKTFGVYFMHDAMLLTNDIDILKEVFLKDFSNFSERSHIPRSSLPYPINHSLPFENGDNWRRMHNTMTPTFSTSKLKLMGPYINRCCDNLSSALQRLSEKRELADVKRIFGAYTMDVIAGTAFGLKTDSLLDENNPFLKALANLFQNATKLGWRSVLLSMFPFLRRVFLLLQISETPSESLFTVYRMIDQLIDDRKKNGANERVDLLHLLLEAEASEADIAAKPQDRLSDLKCTLNSLLGLNDRLATQDQALEDFRINLKSFKRNHLQTRLEENRALTRVEIIAQGMIIFIAGYETTATTLHYMTYLLALNPNKQEKLYNEIIAAIGDAPPTYENVMNIKYLDNVLWETLRYFPPSPLIARRAAEARIIKGVQIDAGSCIGVSIFAFMHDEEIFSDPEKFIPERFDDEDMPTLVRELAFGAGPRQCIGMRLALYEAKMAAVTIIRRFRFIKVPETPMMIRFRKSTLSSPDTPILLEVEPRK